MIQINLLPDVKLNYIKTKRAKRSAVLISLIVGSVSLGIVVLLFVSVNILQKTHINNLNKDIDTYSNELKGIQDLDKILTIQNQLNSLPQLHDDKVAATRLFDYLTKLTPNDTKISDLNIDFVGSTISFEGNAKNLSTVNKFIDTLKFTEFTVDEGEEKKKAFTEAVLADFTRTGEGATYEITTKFDPIIFDNNFVIKLEVPKIITTRSETQKPEVLFETPAETEDEE